MIGQTEVGLLSGKGPLIATFGYEKSDTRLYHFYRFNMVEMTGVEPASKQGFLMRTTVYPIVDFGLDWQ